jgi:hypothetical protein
MANQPTVKLPVTPKLTPPGGMRLAAPKLTLADVAQTVKKPRPVAKKKSKILP